MSRKLFYLMSCLFAVMSFCLAGCGGSSSSVDTSAYSGTYTLVSKDATYTYTSTAVIDTASPPAISISGTTARINNATGDLTQLTEVFSALVITDSGVTFKVAGTDEKGAYNETYRGTITSEVDGSSSPETATITITAATSVGITTSNIQSIITNGSGRRATITASAHNNVAWHGDEEFKNAAAQQPARDALEQ